MLKYVNDVIFQTIHTDKTKCIFTDEEHVFKRVIKVL